MDYDLYNTREISVFPPFPAAPLTGMPPRKDRYRVHLLALGDVGSTLAMGLRLLGGDVISALGICDLREGVPQRWEFELNQINIPGEGRFPPVEIVDMDHILDCDVFLFCASRFVPDTAVKSGDPGHSSPPGRSHGSGRGGAPSRPAGRPRPDCSPSGRRGRAGPPGR